MSAFDPYTVLGVSPESDDADIKRAYRKASSAAHPDRQGGSDERMSEVNRAYDLIKDAESRANYAKHGADGARIPTIDEAARGVILNVLKFQLMRNIPIVADLIHVLRSQIAGQISQCRQEREKTRGEIASLHRRMKRLNGPPGNFIESLFLQEIGRRENNLETFDKDERTLEHAVTLLDNFSYQEAGILPPSGGAIFGGLLGI